jgi:hypothetical protein
MRRTKPFKGGAWRYFFEPVAPRREPAKLNQEEAAELRERADDSALARPLWRTARQG